MLPPKRFPFPFRLGTDICQISRIYRILAKDKEARFLRRILTKNERLAIPASLMSTDASGTAAEVSKDDDFQALKERNPLLWKKASFLAGRFAAKEATFKAHPTRNLTWHDITIVRKRFEQLRDIEGLKNTKAQGKEENKKEVEEEEGLKAVEGEAEETSSTTTPADDEFTNNGSGPPVAIVRSKCDDMPDQEVLVSISHDGDYATAVCIGFPREEALAHADGLGPKEKKGPRKKHERRVRKVEDTVEDQLSYKEFKEFKEFKAWKVRAERKEAKQAKGKDGNDGVAEKTENVTV
ncbi:hypothetical protein BDP55DRAFT_645639 [Colletotrichum godetiae]|uniref:4'-phosphopantetheinyl transferase domain-containing protein n=1 Tax=Colletotrichum godetiae TaxID=1209918 RepID=A0AAJ0AZV9_9PEZI|nr:uncharacterized protein BDP55DRAFT_645639 [Colletotrichum godetiae]KAK1700009.1 hypothetical protein BDP55DRAFT_645639 [Colletotrichum godetiae]